MSFLDSIISGKKPRPRKVMVYGEHGVGKTTWAAKKLKNPIIVEVEDGSGDIDCARIPSEVLQSASDVMSAISELVSGPFETIVVDSGDWFEKMIEDDLDKSGFDRSWGKGSLEIARRWGKFLELLDDAVDAGKTVVILAHHEVRTATDFLGNSWDQIQPKLSKKACSLTMEWADECLYACREDYVRTEKSDFGKKTSVASTSGRRILRTQSHPSYVASRRRDLPDTISMEDLATYLYNGAEN